MKILYMIPYITIDGDERFSKHKTGLGYMIYDIIEYIGKKKGFTGYVTTQSYLNDEVKFKNFTVLKKNIYNIVLNLRLKYLIMYSSILKMDISMNDKIRCFYYFLCGGYLEKQIMMLNPDIIHIHGIDFSTIPFIIAASEKKIPFLITLHGLNSLGESVSTNDYQKKLELEFIKLSDENKIKVSVISSGIKARLKKKIGLKFDNISIITNGATNLNDSLTVPLIPQKYKHKFVSVGIINSNKNQIQILRALTLLPKETLESIEVVFVGKDNTRGAFINSIKELKLDKFVRIMGHVDRNEIHKIYSQADYNITATIDEGFGLSIIEAFQFGIPTICFDDIDVIKDVYDKKCMQLCKNRDDTSLANGILQVTEKKWDRVYIQEYSKKFSLEKMSEEYILLFQKNLKNDLKVNDIKKMLKKVSKGKKNVGFKFR